MRSGRTTRAALTLVIAASLPGHGAAQAPPEPAPPAAVETPVTGQGIIVPLSSLQPPVRPTRRIAIDDAVTMALEQNLDLRVERLNPQILDLSVADARSVYAPTLQTSFLSNIRNNPTSTIFEGGDVRVTDRLLQDSVDLVQEVPWAGGRYTASWNGSHSSTTNVFSSFDPILRSTVRLNYTQPLLRNLKIDGPRQQIAITRANRDLSDIDLRRTIVQTQRVVRNAYWELVYAQSFLEVQRQSLELAEESLRNNRTRVEVGTMAPIDIVEAESEVARNEETVILAEADLARREDRLRTLIFDPDTPDFWALRIVPSDTPVLQAREIDIDTAVRYALEHRTDLHALDNNIETTDINIDYFHNQRLPDVNLDVNYSLVGLGGTQLIRTGGFPGTVSGERHTSFGSVLGDIFTNDFPTWTVRVTIAYPLGRSSAEANLERARLQREQAQVRRRSLEVRIAAEVRDATRNVTTNLQRVEATRAARQLAERRLLAEQRRFDVGLSTSFFVFQAQRDLASARNNEQSAILDYTRSLVDFDAVQEAPVAGF